MGRFTSKGDMGLDHEDRADNMKIRAVFVDMMRTNPAGFKAQQKRLISLKQRGRKAELAINRNEITREQYLEHVEALRDFAINSTATRGWPTLPKPTEAP